LLLEIKIGTIFVRTKYDSLSMCDFDFSKVE